MGREHVFEESSEAGCILCIVDDYLVGKIPGGALKVLFEMVLRVVLGHF